MSAGQQMPPWLQEQIAKMQQSQQNLQSILMQKQQVEMENAESDRALEELKKASRQLLQDALRDETVLFRRLGVKVSELSELEGQSNITNYF